MKLSYFYQIGRVKYWGEPHPRPRFGGEVKPGNVIW